MSDIALNAQGNGAAFVMMDGPNSKPVWLGCFDVEDIVETRGSTNGLFCFDENGEWKFAGETSNAPEMIPVTMTTYSGAQKEVMESAPCPWTLMLVMRICGGKASLFENWERVAILDVRKTTGRTLAGWVRGGPSGEDTPMTTAITADAEPFIIDGLRLEGSNESDAAFTEDVLDIAFSPNQRCAGLCGSRKDICSDGMAVFASDGVAAADVAITTDGGRTWTATAAQPYAISEDISSCSVVQNGSDTYRWYAVRGTTDAGNPAEIAWSVDDGVTWVTANVGSTNGEFAPSAGSFHSIDRWVHLLGSDLGNIYRSDDGGVTWALVFTGTTISGNQINAFAFKDADNGIAVADGGDLVITKDGGVSWETVSVATTDDIDCAVWTGAFYFIGTDAGDLFYSEDGETWLQRGEFEGTGAGAITAIDFANKFDGIVTQTVSGTAVTYQTVNGGFSWQAVSMPTNGGVSSLVMCAADLAIAVGPAVASVSFFSRIIQK